MDRPVTRLLILGGTAESRALAAEVVAWPGFHPVSSLAGRVVSRACRSVRYGSGGSVAPTVSPLG